MARYAAMGRVGGGRVVTVYLETEPNDPPYDELPPDLRARLHSGTYRRIEELALEAHERSGRQTTRFRRYTVETRDEPDDGSDEEDGD